MILILLNVIILLPSNYGGMLVTLESMLKSIFHHAQNLTIRYDPNMDSPKVNEVLIGRGNDTNQGLVLDSYQNEYCSNSEYVYHMDQSTVLQWKHYFNPSHPPIIYMKDLSPDTILASLLLIIRLNGFSHSHHRIPKKWIDYVNHWKLGDISLTGEPFQSWGCLQSALAHIYFSHSNSVKDISKPFTICLKFLISLLVQEVEPHQVTKVEHFSEYQMAKTFLTYEYQRYVNSYNSATKLQLVLPIQDSDQKTVIDAFISTEKAYIGAIKSFVRSDTTRPWLQSGFGMMAVYQPELKGTGNDIVISIDPAKQIHLKDLWLKLEELETLKWQNDRPIDKGEATPSHPWFCDKDYTFIAAPKKIDNHTYGSKLTWNDVINVMWEIYHPAKSLRVKPYRSDGSLGESCEVYQCPPVEEVKKCTKNLFACKWHQFDLQESLVNSPTIKQFLAACANGTSYERLPTINHLPSDHTFDFFEIPGGYAVVHADGVLLLDDWQEETIPFTKYKQEYLKLESRLITITTMKEEIKAKVQYVEDSLKNDKTLKNKQLTHLNYWVASQKMTLRKKILHTSPSISHDLQYFYHAVEKRWGLEAQLTELYESVSEIENIVQGYADTRTNRLVSNITIFGFPLALFTGLFQFIFQGIQNPKWLSLWGVHWLGLILYLSLAGISVFGISFLLKSSHQGLLINRKSAPKKHHMIPQKGERDFNNQSPPM